VLRAFGSERAVVNSDWNPLRIFGAEYCLLLQQGTAHIL